MVTDDRQLCTFHSYRLFIITGLFHNYRLTVTDCFSYRQFNSYRLFTSGYRLFHIQLFHSYRLFHRNSYRLFQSYRLVSQLQTAFTVLHSYRLFHSYRLLHSYRLFHSPWHALFSQLLTVNFMLFFLENLTKLYVGTLSPKVGIPFGEFWTGSYFLLNVPNGPL